MSSMLNRLTVGGGGEGVRGGELVRGPVALDRRHGRVGRPRCRKGGRGRATGREREEGKRGRIYWG